MAGRVRGTVCVKPAGARRISSQYMVDGTVTVGTVIQE